MIEFILRSIVWIGMFALFLQFDMLIGALLWLTMACMVEASLS